MIQRILLMLTRLTATVWTGGAVLFVLITVNEILSGTFETIVLDQIVLLRFPIYYYFAFTLIPLNFLLLSILLVTRRPSRMLAICCSLAGTAVVVLLVDYLFVYSPLREMLLPIGSPRPQAFRQYHRLTETLNTIIMLVMLCLSGLLCGLPERQFLGQSGLVKPHP